MAVVHLRTHHNMWQTYLPDFGFPPNPVTLPWKWKIIVFNKDMTSLRENRASGFRLSMGTIILVRNPKLYARSIMNVISGNSSLICFKNYTAIISEILMAELAKTLKMSRFQWNIFHKLAYHCTDLACLAGERQKHVLSSLGNLQWMSFWLHMSFFSPLLELI